MMQLSEQSCSGLLCPVIGFCAVFCTLLMGETTVDFVNTLLSLLSGPTPNCAHAQMRTRKREMS